MKYEFSVVLEGGSHDEADADRVFDAGCDDATMVTRDGVTRIQFDRKAVSLEAAISSAVDQIKSSGLSVARIEISASEFAAG